MSDRNKALVPRGAEGCNRVRKWLAKEGRYETYWYPYRGKGAPRLPGKPGSPEFIAARDRARASRFVGAKEPIKTAEPGPDTLAWLIEKFLKSQHFNRFDERTKYHYGWVVPSIKNQFGDLPLEALKEKHDVIGDVRGMGLLQAIELVKNRATKEPAPEATNQFMEQCRKGGLIVGKGGFFGNVIRTSPPLNISKGDVDEAIRIMDQAFTAMSPALVGAASRR